MDIFNNVTQTATTGLGTIQSNSYLLYASIIVGVFIVYYILFEILKYLYTFMNSSPYVVSETIIGTQKKVVSQDPDEPGSIILPKSENQEEGIEFSYTLWIYVNKVPVQGGARVLHKGDPTGNTLYCPAMHLLNGNKLRVALNTFRSMDTHVDVTIPLKRWFHVALVVTQNEMKVFGNGRIMASVELDSPPRQNTGDIYLNDKGGFDGFISKVRYYNRALDTQQVLYAARNDLPSRYTNDKILDNIPPYLSGKWYSNVGQ